MVLEINLNLLENINFYQCELTTTQNMNSIKKYQHNNTLR